MSAALADRAREARKSGAVLKAQLSNIRAKARDMPVFVFEGREDVGPYHVWIGRISDTINYAPLPGTGKAQVLDLRRRLVDDVTGLRDGVLFFVDRDFDDLQGDPPGPDLFCTIAYSIENYLVADDVVHSVLLDEFRCPTMSREHDEAMKAFRRARQQFVEAMSPVNYRIYLARRFHITANSLDKPLSRYVDITLVAVTAAYGEADLPSLIPLEREPSEREREQAEADFRALDPLNRHRGKFIHDFLLKWFDELAAERRAPSIGLFPERVPIKFSTAATTMRSLATRSPIPEGLKEFVCSALKMPAPAP